MRWPLPECRREQFGVPYTESYVPGNRLKRFPRPKYACGDQRTCQGAASRFIKAADMGFVAEFHPENMSDRKHSLSGMPFRVKEFFCSVSF